MKDFWYFARKLLRQPRRLALALCCAALSAGGLGAGLALLGPIMDIILTRGAAAGANPAAAAGLGLQSLAMEHNAGSPWIAVPPFIVGMLPVSSMGSIGATLLALGFLTVFGAVCNFLHQSISLALCTRLVAVVRLDAFRHALRLPLLTVVSKGPSEFTSRILRDTAELSGGLVSLTSNVVAQLTKGAMAFAVAVWFDWRLALVATALAPLLGVILRKTGKRIRRGMHGALRAQESLLRVTGESLQGLRALKTAAAESSSVKRFNQANRKVVIEELSVRTVRALSSPLMETIAISVVLGLAYIAAAQIVQGRMRFDNFILAMGSLAVAGGSLRPLTQLWNNVQASSAPAQRLRELLSCAREDESDSKLAPLPRHHQSIQFESVTYSYAKADRPAVSGLTFTVRHGEHVAIVGPNGCGKTTAVALLARLMQPSSGRILLDGMDITSGSLRSLRQQQGFVTQEAVLIRASIYENIRFGLPHASHEQIEAASRAAHADSFIRELPQGYDTEISEAGASLSGGQRQRIAIARAILRDPAMLILDEATSQVDSHSEELINAALAEFGIGRTVLVVAHRLSTMRGADRVIMMDEGKIVDEGSHSQLLERCDEYQRLVRAQLQTA